MSLGIVTVAACVALLAAAETGCAAKPERAVEASTKSVELEPPAVRLPARPVRTPCRPAHRRVSSSRELVAALADGRREAIVLAPGTYDNPKPFADREGDRLYAARLGTAVFKAGVVLGANSGPPGRFDQRAQLRRLRPGEDAQRRDRARLGIGVARVGPRYTARRQPPCRDGAARAAGAGIRRATDRGERASAATGSSSTRTTWATGRDRRSRCPT